MCAVLSLGLGCKKETEPVDRYKVFSATWNDFVITSGSDGNVSQQHLVKVDTISGRVWYWNSLIANTNTIAGWVEMRDSPNFKQPNGTP